MSLAALIAWVLRHEVLAGWLAITAGALAVLGGAYAFGHHAGVFAERPNLEAAQAEARTAMAQTAVTGAAARAADAAAARTIHIHHQAEEAVHDLQAAPGAPQALDPDLLARWRAGLERVRADAAADPDRAGGAEPAEPVPGCS